MEIIYLRIQYGQYDRVPVNICKIIRSVKKKKKYLIEFLMFII